MAYNGFLVKVGTYTIPLEYISAKSYKARQETLFASADRSADGLAMLEALEHKPIVVEFQLSRTESSIVDEVFRNIRSQYIDENAKTVLVTAFVPELGDYVSSEMYIPTTDFVISTINKEEINYEPINVEMIGR